ncbi:MAG: hypothetical protein ABFR05_09420 [Bacteroidota bacterium]
MKTKVFFTGFLIFAFLFSFDSIAQKKKEKYDMYNTVLIKAVRGKEKALENAIKGHNEKFHKEGTDKAWLEVFLTGPCAGNYWWATGPKMFSDIKPRADKEVHLNDWDTNIDALVSEYGAVEFWKFDKKLSFTAPNTEGDKMAIIWFVGLNKYKLESFKALMEKAIAVSKKKGTESFHVYWNQFPAGDGRDVALVFGIKDWAALDFEDTFYTDYEAMYGKDSFKKFINDWNDSHDKVTQSVLKIVD